MLLISVEEHVFFTGEVMFEVKIHDFHTTALNTSMTYIILDFWKKILIILFVVMAMYCYVDASSNFKVASIDLEDIRRALNLN